MDFQTDAIQLEQMAFFPFETPFLTAWLVAHLKSDCSCYYAAMNIASVRVRQVTKRLEMTDFNFLHE